MIVLSNQYCSQDLKQLCEEYLARKISIENIIEMIKLCDEYHTEYLK